MTPVEIGAITVGLTELAKKYGLPGKWAPLFSVVLSLGISILSAYREGTDYFDASTSGLVIGLTATGLYNAGQNMTATKDKTTEA